MTPSSHRDVPDLPSHAPASHGGEQHIESGRTTDESRGLPSGATLLDAYAEIHRAVAASVNASYVVLLLADRAADVFLPQVVVVDGVLATPRALSPIPIEECTAARAYRTGSTSASPTLTRSWRELVAPARPQRSGGAEIAAPISYDRETIGVLLVQTDHADGFRPADAGLVALIARQVGFVLENARLRENRRRESEIADAAIAIARVALSAPTVADAAGAILSVLDGVVPTAGKSLAVAAEGTARPSHTPGQPALRQVATSGVSADATGIIMPLVARERIIGVLAVSISGAGRALSADARDSLHRLAAPVALALEAQMLAERERRRREREGMLATALATMDHPVFILSLEHDVLYANAAAVREYGYAVEELVGRSADTLGTTSLPIPPDDVVALPNGGGRGNDVHVAEQMHRRKDGSQFPASVALSVIREQAGLSVGYVLSVRDTTEDRRIAEQLRQSEKLAALGELVAGVAHELNNPLAGISAFAQLMMDEELTDEQHESVRLIKREADRAVSVIRDLLVFSRKAGPTTGPVDVNAIVQLSIRLRGYSLRTVGIDVETELASDMPLVAGDDQKLQQVMLNLLVNAEYAMRGSREKRLIIRTLHPGSGVTIEVTDTGTGMSADVRARIFEPFFTTKPAGVGTGLGLSVSYGIIDAHGGTIDVQSEIGRGTTFRITLPVSAANDQRSKISA